MSEKKNSKLFIANISSKVYSKTKSSLFKKVNESDLRDLFDKYGTIVEVSIREKGDRYAFIDYEDPGDAETAYER